MKSVYKYKPSFTMRDVIKIMGMVIKEQNLYHKLKIGIGKRMRGKGILNVPYRLYNVADIHYKFCPMKTMVYEEMVAIRTNFISRICPIVWNETYLALKFIIEKLEGIPQEYKDFFVKKYHEDISKGKFTKQPFSSFTINEISYGILNKYMSAKYYRIKVITKETGYGLIRKFQDENKKKNIYIKYTNIITTELLRILSDTIIEKA